MEPITHYFGIERRGSLLFIGVGVVAASLFITLYLAFFLIRDGRCSGARRAARDSLGASAQAGVDRQVHDRDPGDGQGQSSGGRVQGMLGGIAFWLLGVSGAFLWAVLMAFLSPLPAVGAALVWLPVAIYPSMRRCGERKMR